MSGCARTELVAEPSFCAVSGPIMIGREDVLTDQTARLILNHNLTGKQLAANTGVALNSITPRFAQLSRRGLIHAAGGNGRETVWALGNGVA